MLYFPKSRFQVSHEVAVAAGATVTAEGQALVASTVAGVFGAAPSSNSAGEVFLGVAVAEQLTLTSLPKVEQFVQGAGNTQTLSRTPSGGTLLVYDVTAGAVIAAGAGGWSLTGAFLSLDAGTNGHTVRVFYRYAPTTLEAQAVQGDIRPGGAAALQLNQVGVVKSGIIYTSEYDTAVNWLAANPVIKLGANGRFTIGGTGTTINGVVISAPHSNGPDGAFLGIEFSAA